MELVALLHRGHVGRENDDVEVLPLHGRHETIVALATSCGVTRPSRAEQGVGEAFARGAHLDAVADLKARQLQDLDAVAPVDHGLGGRQVDDLLHRDRDPLPIAENGCRGDGEGHALRVVTPTRAGECATAGLGEHLVQDVRLGAGHPALVDAVDGLVEHDEVVETLVLLGVTRLGEA